MLTCDYNMPVLMMELRAGLSGSSRMAKVGTPTREASLSAAKLQPSAPHRQLGYYWHCWRKMMSLRNFRATLAGREIGPQLVFLLLLGSRARSSSQ